MLMTKVKNSFAAMVGKLGAWLVLAGVVALTMFALLTVVQGFGELGVAVAEMIKPEPSLLERVTSNVLGLF